MESGSCGIWHEVEHGVCLLQCPSSSSSLPLCVWGSWVEMGPMPLGLELTFLTWWEWEWEWESSIWHFLHSNLPPLLDLSYFISHSTILPKKHPLVKRVIFFFCLGIFVNRRRGVKIFKLVRLPWRNTCDLVCYLGVTFQIGETSLKICGVRWNQNGRHLCLKVWS